MRLLSAIIRNYRLHKEIKIAFGHDLTLIGGPNESGKSTIAEALHRALFFKAKGTSDLHRNMQSYFHGGIPEVELEFQQDGINYKLQKRFHNNAASVFLNIPGKTLLQGDEAESILSSILRNSTNLRAGASLEQWAHLWIWQGKSATDPTSTASQYHNDLFQRLQKEGGGALVQSEFDGWVANQIDKEYILYYTDTGKIKSGSALGLKSAEYQEAVTQFEMVADKLQKLEQAAIDFDIYTTDLEATKSAIEFLQKEQKETEDRLKLINQINLKLEKANSELKNAANRLHLLQSEANQINDAEKEINILTTHLAPFDEEARKLKTDISDLESALKDVDAGIMMSESEIKLTRLKFELASYYAELSKLKDDLSRQQSRAEIINNINKNIQELEQQKSSLPAITKTVLNKLRKTEKDVNDLELALKSMSASIEVLKCPKPVKVGDQALKQGDVLKINDKINVNLGGQWEINISPGGGNSLETARTEFNNKQEELSSLLNSYTINSVAEAELYYENSRKIDEQIENKRAELRGLNPEMVKENISRLEQDILATEGKIHRTRQPDNRLDSFPMTEDPLALKNTLEAEFHSVQEQ